jgi:hypothetical protein
MSRALLCSAVLSFLLLTSCAQKESSANRPHASVTLRDGSMVTGTVLESSASEIKLTGDDNITRTIPMTQVKSIDYGDAPAAQAAQAPPPQAAPLPAPAQAPSNPPDRRSALEPERPRREHPTEAVVTTRTHELPSGTQLSVRTDETIDSGKAVEGQTFAAEVTRDVVDAEGAVVIPAGSNAQVVIRSAAQGGRFRGASDLVLDLQSVSIGGRQYQISTADMQQRGKQGLGANKRTGEFAGGGAAVGAIIGAIAGHGKGAAIGALSGAGAGTAAQVLTKGGAIRIPAETVLTFQLDKPLRVVAAR